MMNERSPQGPSLGLHSESIQADTRSLAETQWCHIFLHKKRIGPVSENDYPIFECISAEIPESCHTTSRNLIYETSGIITHHQLGFYFPDWPQFCFFVHLREKFESDDNSDTPWGVINLDQYINRLNNPASSPKPFLSSKLVKIKWMECVEKLEFNTYIYGKYCGSFKVGINIQNDIKSIKNYLFSCINATSYSWLTDNCKHFIKRCQECLEGNKHLEYVLTNPNNRLYWKSMWLKLERNGESLRLVLKGWCFCDPKRTAYNDPLFHDFNDRDEIDFLPPSVN